MIFNSQAHLNPRWCLIILRVNLATNFQDLVAKVKNLVTLAPVLGTISRPDLVPARTRTRVVRFRAQCTDHWTTGQIHGIGMPVEQLTTHVKSNTL